jgi:5-methylcytosine-specific restriction endonuclease McrA
MAKTLKGLNDWFKKHGAYLRSPQWKAKAGMVMRRDGFVCQACLQNPATQVHHLTYDRWGHEPLFDLVAVCKPCHDTITAISRGELKAEPDLTHTDNGRYYDDIPY